MSAWWHKAPLRQALLRHFLNYGISELMIWPHFYLKAWQASHSFLLLSNNNKKWLKTNACVHSSCTDKLDTWEQTRQCFLIVCVHSLSACLLYDANPLAVLPWKKARRWRRTRKRQYLPEGVMPEWWDEMAETIGVPPSSLTIHSMAWHEKRTLQALEVLEETSACICRRHCCFPITHLLQLENWNQSSGESWEL